MLTPAQLNQVLNHRYATKAFDPSKTITAEEKQALLEALQLSPSSFGLQLWKFYIIEDADVRAQLRKESWDQGQVTDSSLFVVLAAETTVDEARVDKWMARMAEVQGIPVAQLDGFKGMLMGFLAAMTPEQQVDWAKKQVYIALGQLMTSAALLQLDSCPLEGIDPAAYDQILGLSDKGYTTAVACAIGHRSAEDHHASSPKVRFPLQDIIETV